MMKQLRLALAMAAGLAVTAILPAFADPIKIVLSNDNNDAGLKGKTFERLSAEIKARLGNRVKVTLYHSGMLFSQNDQLEGLKIGGAHLISTNPGIYSSITENLNAFELPFLLDSPEKILAAMQDPTIREAFVPQLEARNVKPVAYWMNGPRDLGYRGDKAVFLPSDAKGMKIRVQPAPLYIKTFSTVGAYAAGINWSETPVALEKGLVDGAEISPNSWRGAGLYKMIDQLTLTDHIYSYHIVSVNRTWWDGLPEDIRIALTEALDVTTQWNVENAKRVNDEDIAFIEQAGVRINRLTAEQRLQWIKAMEPVWAEFGGRVIGNRVMERLREISG